MNPRITISTDEADALVEAYVAADAPTDNPLAALEALRAALRPIADHVAHIRNGMAERDTYRRRVDEALGNPVGARRPDPQSYNERANAYPDRDYVVKIDCPEFTAVCPMTGQPDFGRFELEYVPDQRLLELKSLKLYLQAFRNVGIFHETVTNRVLDDVRAALQPRRMAIVAHYNARGGITTVVEARWPDTD
jgi:7-cyano-7-deazaguanine reductase